MDERVYMRNKQGKQTEFAATLVWQSVQMIVGAEEPVRAEFSYS